MHSSTMISCSLFNISSFAQQRTTLSSKFCRPLPVSLPRSILSVASHSRYRIPKKQLVICRATSNDDDKPPPGCSRYDVTLGRPLGLVLEEDKAGNIIVVEVVPGGRAALTGEVGVGDQLIATSGLIKTTEMQYGEIKVGGGEQFIRLNTRGESFKTVMAAITSHQAHMGVKLEFQRCESNRIQS